MLMSMYIILFIYIIMINDAPVHIIIYIYIYYEIHIDTYNVVYRLVSWASIVIFSKIIEYPVNGGGGPLL